MLGVWELDGGRIYGYVLIFFNDTATTEIYTLSLHDALPISGNSLRTKFNAFIDSRTAAGREGRCSDHSNEKAA